MSEEPAGAEAQTQEPGPADETPVGRRVVLGMLGLGAAGVLFGSRAADLLERITAPITSRDGTGLLSLFPVGRFRIYTVTGHLPVRSVDGYRLTVNGAVESPLDLSLADLKAMPTTRMTRDFQCVTGWRVHDVNWAGVRLSELFSRAGALPTAQGVRFVSFDGVYTESLTMDQAQARDVIVAYEMEGKPLSNAHGGPARLYVPSMYGYKSCKWLDAIEVTEDMPEPGYWEVRGYDTDAWIGSSNGRQDRPA